MRILALAIGLLLSGTLQAQDLIVRRATVGGGGPTCVAGGLSTVDETFDTDPGYDETWTEQINGSGTLDPDDTTRTETYFDDESWEAVHAVGTDPNTRAFTDIGTERTTYYAAFSIKVTSLTIATDTRIGIFKMTRGGNKNVCVLLEDSSGTTSWALHTADAGVDTDCSNGGIQQATRAFDLNHVYVFETYYNENGTTDDWGWRVWDCGTNGTSCTSTPDTDDSGTEDIYSLGIDDLEAGWRRQTGTMGGTHYIGFVVGGTTQPCS